MIQEIYTEESITLLIKKINHLKPVNILIVTGSASYLLSGAKALINKLFGKYNLIFFNEFDVNPNIIDLEKGIILCNEVNIDLIIAAGGGSVIDMAKLIRCYINCKIPLKDLIKSNEIYSNNEIPFLAIPTTAGSGSESTHFTVIYIDGRKYSVSHESILPDFVLLIPSLTYNTPFYLTACCGADAFSQAIESYWSVHSTEESRTYAKEAVFLLWEFLPLAVKNDINAKNKICIASNLAGRAINISFTTAPHAYSYGLTSYLGIPHGHAVSLTLPYFFNLNLKVSSYNCNDSRGVSFVNEIMIDLLNILKIDFDEAPQKLFMYFNLLFGNIHKETILKITDDERQKLAENINLQRLQNNPVIITKNDIENINFFF